jgi:hypothetical protein
MARLSTAALLLVLAGIVSTTANAGPAPGSVSYVTERSCATVDSATACDGNSPGQKIQMSEITGGVSLPSNSNLSFGPNDQTSGQVTFNASGVPTVTGSTMTTADGDFRLNANQFAYFSFTNSGPNAVALPFAATFAYADSSASPASTPSADGGALPGGAIYNAFFAVADPALLDPSATPIDLINTLFFNSSCGTAGIFAGGAITGDTTGGPFSQGIGLSSCSAGPFTVAPGQTVLVLDGFAIPSNRGGFIDDASLTLSAAPEPAVWAILLLGLLGIGAILRNGRSRHAGSLLGPSTSA